MTTVPLFYLSENLHSSLSVVGGESPVCSPGASHEEARFQDGAWTVHLHPVPVHLLAGMAPLHSDLRSPGGLLQCAHPRIWRLDRGIIDSLWGRGASPQGALQHAKVRPLSQCFFIHVSILQMGKYLNAAINCQTWRWL